MNLCYPNAISETYLECKRL